MPGALVEPDGTMSAMLADRVRQAAALWHAGKVEKILVSGDHGSWDYDEPGTMRKALGTAISDQHPAGPLNAVALFFPREQEKRHATIRSAPARSSL